MSCSNPAIEVRQNTSKTEYAIIMHCVHKEYGYLMPVGNVLYSKSKEFEQRTKQLIMDAYIIASNAVDLQAWELDGDDVAQRKFEHLYPRSVFVEIDKDKDQIELEPMTQQQGGGVGIQEDVLMLKLSDSDDKLLEFIQLAFERSR